MRLPANYGSVYKLKGNRRKPWIAIIQTGKQEDGKPIKKPLGYYADQKSALQALAQYHSAPVAFANKKLTFKDVYTSCMEGHLEGKSMSTKRVYHSAFKTFEPLHYLIFADIRVYQIEPIIKHLVGSKSRKGHMVTLLGLMYKYALKMEISDVDRSKGLEVGKVAKAAEKTTYTDLEIKRLWKNKGDLSADIILILLYSGMRVSELLEMKKENVKLSAGYMVGGNKTETGKNRIIPIHDKILDIITKYYNRASEYLIEVDGQRFRYQYFREMFMGNKEEFGLPRSRAIHETRHTFVTKLNEAGVDDHLIKLIVGHSMQDITKKVYTHVSLDRLIEAVNLLA